MNEAVAAVENWFTIDRALFMYYIYNAAVQSLPTPDAESGKGYRFFYGFLHTLAGNIELVRSKLAKQK